METEKKCFCL